MSSTLRERRRQALREEIITAAQSLIAAKGYAAMSMDELAAQVGISKPTLYTYFPTGKDELVVEAATRDMQEMIALIEREAPGRTPMERLRLIMEQILERQIRMHTLGIGPWPEIFHLLCSHPGSYSCIERIARDTVTLVQEAMARGEIDPALDPEGVVGAFYAMASALHKSQITGVGLNNPQRAVKTLITMFERGVRAENTEHRI